MLFVPITSIPPEIKTTTPKPEFPLTERIKTTSTSTSTTTTTTTTIPPQIPEKIPLDCIELCDKLKW
jgi:hypothetical protein